MSESGGWPNILREETEKAFLDIDNSDLKSLSIICMKNANGRFGVIVKNQMKLNVYIVVDNDYNDTPEHVYNYESLTDMLDAGWVVD